ncbi:hypothetical protein, partial [Caulobacter vibrioides]
MEGPADRATPLSDQNRSSTGCNPAARS